MKRASLINLAEVLSEIPYDEEVFMEIRTLIINSPDLAVSLKNTLKNMSDFIDLVEKSLLKE